MIRLTFQTSGLVSWKPSDHSEPAEPMVADPTGVFRLPLAITRNSAVPRRDSGKAAVVRPLTRTKSSPACSRVDRMKASVNALPTVRSPCTNWTSGVRCRVTPSTSEASTARLRSSTTMAIRSPWVTQARSTTNTTRARARATPADDQELALLRDPERDQRRHRHHPQPGEEVRGVLREKLHEIRLHAKEEEVTRPETK